MKRVTIKEYREAKKIMLEYENQIRHYGNLLENYGNKEREKYQKINDNTDKHTGISGTVRPHDYQ
jgi:hypothetical protein